MKKTMLVETSGPRLDAFLAKNLKGYTRVFLKGLIEGGHVTVDGETRDADDRVSEGERVRVELPELEPGAMCYMMSKQQYLNDSVTNWHPHVMVFVAGDAAKSWGADKNDSPVIFSNDPQERVTVFMFWVGNWSDGSPGPPMAY